MVGAATPRTRACALRAAALCALVACLASLAVCTPAMAAGLFGSQDDITNWLSGAMDYVGNLFCGSLINSMLDVLQSTLAEIVSGDGSLLNVEFTQLFTEASGVYEMAAQVQDAVIKPIAMSILALVMLVQLVKVAQRADGTASMPGFREVVFLFVFFIIFSYLIDHSAEICVGAYDVCRSIVQRVATMGGANVPVGDAFYDVDPTVTALADNLRALVMILVADVVLRIASIIVFVSVWIRALQLYVYFMVAPLPFALLGTDATRQMGVNFMKNFAALCFAAVIMMLVLAIYPRIVAGIIMSNSFMGSGFVKIVAAGVVMCFCLMKAGAWSREILGG